MSKAADDIMHYVDTHTAPHLMSKQDALETLEQIIDDIKMRMEALRDEIRNEGGEE